MGDISFPQVLDVFYFFHLMLIKLSGSFTDTVDVFEAIVI